MPIRFLLFLSALCILILSCDSKVKERTIHRRNFSKNVFEEEFASVQVGCDTSNMIVLLSNTKWLTIDPRYASKEYDDLYVLELNKKLELQERTYKHDLILEKIQNGAFMFRYTGIQTVIDTLKAIDFKSINSGSKIDSSKIFSFEGSKYYRVNEGYKQDKDVQTIYKSMRTEDKGRVVCACDYFIDK